MLSFMIEGLYRDLVRLSDTVDNVDRTRISARMIDNVYVYVGDYVKSVALVTRINKIDTDQVPEEIISIITAMITPELAAQEVSA